MRVVMLSMLICCFVAGCATAPPPNAIAMKGSNWKECVVQHDLDRYKSWKNPNPAMNADFEVTYYMSAGDLVLCVDYDEKISFAMYIASEESAGQRYASRGKY